MIPGHVGLVRRPRLSEALESGTRRRVTLVSGAAGSGKTLLVDAWLGEQAWSGSVAHFAVESADWDEASFWSAVFGAFSASGPSETPDPGGDPADRLAERVRAVAMPVLLVVDGFDRLSARTASRCLAALLTVGPAELRLLLVTRSDPWLGVHRLRVAGEVTEIRAEELAFTVDEAGELLTAAGIHLSQQSLVRLHGRTEGWAAGLRLAALGLAGRADPDRLAEEFAGTERTVAEYLTGEVLAGQRPAVRRLLRRTSVVDSVCGPLADVLTGRSDGDRTLHQLATANAFVSAIDPARTWYRYHPLLADLLRMELRRETPQDLKRLERSAARWYAANGRPLEAIRHAQAGKSWRFAAALLLQHWIALYLDRRQATIRELLAAFPADVMGSDPGLAAIASADRFASGSLGVADAHLARAERAASVPEPLRRRFEATLAVVRIARARTRGDLDMVTEAARAILTPAHAEVSVDTDALRAFTLMSMGCVEQWTARLEDAERHLEEGLALARSIGRPDLAIACLGPLAHVATLMWQAGLVEVRSHEAIDLAGRRGWSEDPLVGPAYVALGGHVLARGQFEEAELWLDRATGALSGVQDPEATVALPVTRGRLRFIQGRFHEAIEYFRAAERSPAVHRLATSARTWRLRAYVRLGDLEAARAEVAQIGDAARDAPEWWNLTAHLHLADGDPASAIEAVRPIVDGSAPAFDDNLEIEAAMLEAVGHERLGEPEVAVRALELALALAEPREQVWIILTVPGVEPLLMRHPRHRTAHGAFLSELLDRLAGVSSPHLADEASVLARILSPRERDVLGFLPTNLSAAAIAGELVVSVHTVKTHMRSLYAKLGVHRRADAVMRARALGVLTPERRGR